MLKIEGGLIINLECLSNKVDIAAEVNGFSKECSRAKIKYSLYFPSGFNTILYTRQSLHSLFSQPSLYLPLE